ncbi:MAG: sensor histidine kinase [Pseudomonadota bacterium]
MLRPNYALLLMVGGMLGLIALAAWERAVLNTVIELTNARKTTRDTVILAVQLDSHLRALDRAHMTLLLDAGPPARQAFATAEAQLLADVERLTERTASIAQIAPLTASVVGAVAGARTVLDADRLREAQPTASHSAQASGALVTAASVQIDRLTEALYRRIDHFDQGVSQWQRRASITRGSMLALVLALLGGAYGLLWTESRRRQRAERALRNSHEQLETLVSERTAELEHSRQDLRALAVSLDESIEAERRRLAREVHDQLGQTLTALKLYLHRRVAENPDLRPYDQLLDEAIATARRIAADLRPPLLDDLGLAAALGQLAQHDGLTATVRVEDDHVLTPRLAEQLFRIAQEAVTNVLRHAKAAHIHIEGGATDQAYLLAVEDDGVGFDPQAVRRGALGLVGMRERAHLAGGECRWVTPRFGGTRVEIRLPLAEALAA